MSDILCHIYNTKNKVEWDEFVENSKNAPFFFKRNFMEYHADRFTDYSVMIYRSKEIVGILPACISLESKIVFSHAGLTFGGLITNKKMTSPIFLKCFSSLIQFLKNQGIEKLIYKSVPSHYHQYPASEEHYAAFRLGGCLIRRDIGSVIDLRRKLPHSTLRDRMIKKGCKLGIRVIETENYHSYWEILNEVLETRHEARPVHSLKEIEYLHNLFKGNIRLFGAFKDNEMLAGVVIFESKTVAHTQYIASSDDGRESGALDLIFNHLITNVYKDKDFFSFGISTEHDGMVLNEGLVNQKESFGARAIVNDTYEFNLITASQYT
jgi:hypothetical protein